MDLMGPRKYSATSVRRRSRPCGRISRFRNAKGGARTIPVRTCAAPRRAKRLPQVMSEPDVSRPAPNPDRRKTDFQRLALTSRSWSCLYASGIRGRSSWGSTSGDVDLERRQDVRRHRRRGNNSVRSLSTMRPPTRSATTWECVPHSDEALFLPGASSGSRTAGLGRVSGLRPLAGSRSLTPHVMRTRSRRTCWKCADIMTSRNCWDTRACRRRRSTPTSRSSTCGAVTRRRTSRANGPKKR